VLSLAHLGKVSYVLGLAVLVLLLSSPSKTEGQFRVIMPGTFPPVQAPFNPINGNGFTFGGFGALGGIGGFGTFGGGGFGALGGGPRPVGMKRPNRGSGRP
jgi:hypothetical protein